MMILNEAGQTFISEGEKLMLHIGEEVVVNELGGVYAGLGGIITEIRDGADIETENPSVDIYCDFEFPNVPLFEELLLLRLDCEKSEVCLKGIIMSADMLEPKMRYQFNPCGQQLYVLTYHVDCDAETDTYELGVSNSIDALKNALDDHARKNPHLQEPDNLWRRVEDDDGIFRLCYDQESIYICYSILPINYVME